MSNNHWSPFFRRSFQYNGNDLGQARPFHMYDSCAHNRHLPFSMQGSQMSIAVQNSRCEYNPNTTYGAMANEAVLLFLEIVNVAPLRCLINNSVITKDLRPMAYAKSVVQGPCATLAIMVACGWDYSFPVNKCQPVDFQQSGEHDDRVKYEQVILPMMEYMARKCNIYEDYRFTIDEVKTINAKTWQDAFKRRMRNYGLWDNEFLRTNLNMANNRMLKGVNIYHAAAVAKFVRGITDNMQGYNKDLLFITEAQKLPSWWANSNNGRKYTS